MRKQYIPVTTVKKKPVNKVKTLPIEIKERDLMDLLDIVILQQMLFEKIDSFRIENHYDKQGIKKALTDFIEIATPQAERDYATVFKNGEGETQQIISEYEQLVAQIRDFNVPQKVILNQMILAFNLEKDTIEATVHRVLKKNNKLDYVGA